MLKVLRDAPISVFISKLKSKVKLILHRTKWTKKRETESEDERKRGKEAKRRYSKSCTERRRIKMDDRKVRAQRNPVAKSQCKFNIHRSKWAADRRTSIHGVSGKCFGFSNAEAAKIKCKEQ